MRDTNQNHTNQHTEKTNDKYDKYFAPECLLNHWILMWSRHYSLYDTNLKTNKKICKELRASPASC